MTQEQLLEYNKRCAEFLGHIFYNKEITFGRSESSEPTILPNFIKINEKEYQLPQLKFHSNWNWIMEVFEKINQSKITASMNGISDSIIPYIAARRPIVEALIRNNKEAVVEAINQFLIWYEQDKR